ncbi:MAG: class I SAM-dependent RNA methyltransferase [Chlamydiia bacterium]|nr:class I SAM-dependent RNA methyltransferase [Chlamydiia bacterium]
MVFGGRALTRIDGCVTFVPFGAPGDHVELTITQKKKNYQIAQIKKILQEGPGRRTPRCPHFKVCAGCQLQHLDYSTQLESKKGFIEEALHVNHVNIHASPQEWSYRSHIRFNLQKDAIGFRMGFIGHDNHSLIEPSICPIFSEDSVFFSTLKQELLTLPNEGIRSASLRLFKKKKGMVLAFSFFPKLPKKTFLFPCSIGTAYKSPAGEKYFGETSLSQKILGLDVSFSPYGFMQNNLPLSAKLYQTLVNWVGDVPQKIFDLYCGVGITTALLSQRGHDVLGIELNRSLSPCENAQIRYGSVEKILPKIGRTPDVTLVNPPRTGLSKEVLPLLNSSRLLYVSCMPSTLARDLQRLASRYRIKRVEGFDLFPQTTHVESLVLLEHIEQKKL